MSPKTKEKYDRLNRVLEKFISGSSFDDENFFYEDEDFVCYYFRQNPQFLYNLTL